MRYKIVLLVASLVTISAFARMFSLFTDWSTVEDRARDIIIVDCGEPIPYSTNKNIVFSNAPQSYRKVEVLAVLKGTNGLGPARFQTDRLLHGGQKYLVFANLQGGIYQAFERYKVVPLGDHFENEWIAGKSFDAQIDLLFRISQSVVNREIQEDQELKAQLETFPKKTSP